MAIGEDVYLDVYNSVVRYIKDSIQEMLENGIAQDLSFQDIDRHAEEQVLENRDYILLRSFSSNQEYILSDYVFEVGVTTFEDKNGFRHRAIINELNKKFRPMNTMQVYSHKTLEKRLGVLKFTEPTTIQPTAKYNTRAVQYLLVNAVTTETKL